MSTLTIPRRIGPKPIKYDLPMVAEVVPPEYAHHLDKARRGNVRAAIALKCLDCCCWQRAEVAACEITECSLHHIRPYGRGKRRTKAG